MSMNRIIEQMRVEGKKFVTSQELSEYSNNLHYDYENVKRYLISQGDFVKIFKDIFYIKSTAEKKLKKLDWSLLEIVGKALDVKKINNWYFGFYTALTFNEIPHKDQEEIYLINDSLSKNNPVKIGGHLFRIIRLESNLFKFGTINNKVKYSDPEKTVLDLIYLWKYSGLIEMKILKQISSYMGYLSKSKIMSYAKHYPESNRDILNKYYKNVPITAATS